MELSAETLSWLERCFARAVRYFRQKGLSEADAEDCAAEVRLQLLYRLQQGVPLSDGYFLAVLRGGYADFVAAQAEQPACILLDNVKSAEGGVKQNCFSLSKCAVRWNSSAKPTVNCFCFTMKRDTHLKS